MEIKKEKSTAPPPSNGPMADDYLFSGKVGARPPLLTCCRRPTVRTEDMCSTGPALHNVLGNAVHTIHRQGCLYLTMTIRNVCVFLCLPARFRDSG